MQNEVALTLTLELTLSKSNRWSEDCEFLSRLHSPYLTMRTNLLIVDKGLLRNLLPLAIVQETFQGRDGLVRSVLLKTKTSNEVRRSVHHVVRLEADG